MGFNPFKSVKKAVKKIVKSDIGKAALGIGAFLYGPKLMPGYQPLGGKGGWTAAMKGLPPWLIGQPGSRVGEELIPYKPSVLGKLKAGWGAMDTGKKALAIAGVTPAVMKGIEALDVPEEEVIPGDEDSKKAHADYLRMRKYFLENDPDVWTEQAPMFSSEGGRVGAQAGMYAGNPMMNRGNPMMNQMRGNPMMNQQRGALVGPSALSHNQGLMGTQQGNQMRGDPRMMAQLTQRPRTPDLPKQNEDDELIMLIKQLISMGYEMEQLRGRTKEELVQMIVAASGPVDKGEGEVVEEEEVMTAAGGGIMRPGYALGDEVVEENIEVAGVDTPGEDLEDLIELRRDFFEVFGREPRTMDELKKFRRDRPSDDPGHLEGAVEEEENIKVAGPDWYTRRVQELMQFEDMSYEQAAEQAYEEGPMGGGDYDREDTAQGGIMRTGYALGSEHPIIPSKDGMQLDMRDMGGYQPLGKQEKKDDVRALLAQGEFVMTSDAVRGLGGGDREVGAKKMYDMMHNLEAMA